MNEYINSIENIIGSKLETETIDRIPFSEETLKSLANFSSTYTLKESHKTDSNLNAFLSFEDIISNDFNTYRF